MGTISKVDAAAVAGIAKESTVAVAGISKYIGQDWPSGTPTTLTAETAAVFESAATTFTSVCLIDSTHAIACYRDEGNSNYGTAVCLTLSGTTVTAETPVVFAEVAVDYVSVTAMDSSHAIVCYRDTADSFKGKAACLTLSGTTITAESPVTFETGACSYICVVKMDATHAIAAYADNGNGGGRPTACCLSLSGTTITAATPVQVNTVATAHTSVCALDSQYAMMTMGNAQVGKAFVLSLSGTTITVGSSTTYSGTTNTIDSFVANVSSTEAVVIYKNSASPYQAFACLLTRSGTTPSAGDVLTVESAMASGRPYFAAVAITATDVMLLFKDTAPSNYLSGTILHISGTTLTMETLATFSASIASYGSLALIDSSKALFAYQDNNNSTYGTARIFSIS